MGVVAKVDMAAAKVVLEEGASEEAAMEEAALEEEEVKVVAIVSTAVSLATSPEIAQSLAGRKAKAVDTAVARASAANGNNKALAHLEMVAVSVTTNLALGRSPVCLSLVSSVE